MLLVANRRNFYLKTIIHSDVIIGMRKLLLILTLVLFIASGYVIAEEKCIYKDSIQVKTNVEVSKTEIIKEYSKDLENRQRKCIIDFKIKVDKWHKLHGEYIYGPELSEQEACAKAKHTAMGEFVANNFTNFVTNIEFINCKEIQGDVELLRVDLDEVTIEEALKSIKSNDNQGFLTKMWYKLDEHQQDRFITALIMRIFGF